jgi:hypothetical protein
MNNMLATVVIAGSSGSSNGVDFIHSLLVLVIIGIVLGIIYYLVNAAPFIPALFKQVLGWLIILVGALVLINVLLSIIGYPLVRF